MIIIRTHPYDGHYTRLFMRGQYRRLLRNLARRIQLRAGWSMPRKREDRHQEMYMQLNYLSLIYSSQNFMTLGTNMKKIYGNAGKSPVFVSLTVRRIVR